MATVTKVPVCYKSALYCYKSALSNVTKVPQLGYKSALGYKSSLPWLQKFPMGLQKFPFLVTKVPKNMETDFKTLSTVVCTIDY